MTSKSRARKFNKKRSNPDDDPYTRRLRKASDAAKAARAAARSSVDEVHIRIDISQARIVSASLVPEGQGTGYILAVGEEPVSTGLQEGTRYVGSVRGIRNGVSGPEVPFDSEEGIRQEATPDTASAAPARGAAGAEGQPSAESEAEPQGRASSEEGADEVHWTYFEKEVNGLPQYVGKSTCFCDIRADHWTNLGEN